MKKRSKNRIKTRKNADNWIYGYHSVISAIQNKNRVKYRLILDQGAKKKLDNEPNIIIPKSLSVAIKEKHEIQKLFSSKVNHQGIALEIEKLPQLKLQDFVKKFLNTNTSTVAILDQLEDSQNVGAIFRSAYGLGIDAIVLTENQTVSENSFIAKTAAGGLDKIPYTTVTNISSAIKILQENEFWIYGLDGRSNKIISDIRFPKKTALVLGSEAEGMRGITRNLCDEVFKININKNLESLNVSNAAAITFFYLNNR
ncbi:23S rRNA (guanosine(2251)-2'-O)-methyltransferase RlmB [Pelagibacteraceae bacterium]|nr:23S rRNA (guanosine(2251)-2'-O)-methyltransferase RlmB [Pelagibacteraceae bacterium]